MRIETRAPSAESGSISSEPGVGRLVVCPDCDSVYSLPDLTRGQVALCTRCRTVLGRHYMAHANALPLLLACAILFAVATFLPILEVDVNGLRTEINLWNAPESMRDGSITSAAVVVSLTTFVIPGMQIALALWLLGFAAVKRRAPGFNWLLRMLKSAHRWSMTEVFLLAALVVIVKLSDWLPVDPGPGLWALAGVTLLIAALGRFDSQHWWNLAERRDA